METVIAKFGQIYQSFGQARGRRQCRRRRCSARCPSGTGGGSLSPAQLQDAAKGLPGPARGNGRLGVAEHQLGDLGTGAKQHINEVWTSSGAAVLPDRVQQPLSVLSPTGRPMCSSTISPSCWRRKAWLTSSSPTTSSRWPTPPTCRGNGPPTAAALGLVHRCADAVPAGRRDPRRPVRRRCDDVW